MSDDEHKGVEIDYRVEEDGVISQGVAIHDPEAFRRPTTMRVAWAPTFMGEKPDWDLPAEEAEATTPVMIVSSFPLMGMSQEEALDKADTVVYLMDPETASTVIGDLIQMFTKNKAQTMLAQSVLEAIFNMDQDDLPDFMKDPGEDG